MSAIVHPAFSFKSGANLTVLPRGLKPLKRFVGKCKNGPKVGPILAVSLPPQPPKGHGFAKYPKKDALTPSVSRQQQIAPKKENAVQRWFSDMIDKAKNSSEDLKTFVPMTLLFFTMAFINTIVSNLSVSLILTAPGGGAGVIPFLTVYAAFPLTIGATLLYAYASHFVSHKRLFSITVGLFALTNLLFAVCLFPHHEALHLPGVADTLGKFLPSGLNGAVGMVRNWTFSIFYCLSEMWGDMGISLLFWGFANDITTSKQAPILYPLMGIGANVAQTLGGVVLKAFSAGNAAAFNSRFQTLLFQIVAAMMVVVFIHHHIASRKERKQTVAPIVHPKLLSSMNDSKGVISFGSCQSQNKLKSHPLSYKGRVMTTSFRYMEANAKLPAPVPAEKPKPTFMDSLKTIMSSNVVKSLGIMTIAQALSVTLMEFVWKSHVGIAYPTPAACSAFMGDIATVIGVVTGSMMFLSPILFTKIGWKGVARITPLLMTVGGCVFFACCSAYHICGHLGMTSLAQKFLPVTVLGGAFLFVLSRGTKFSLFKPSEEMVYIKMDKDQRTKGKAAVDVVAANVGKSGGSLLQQMLLVGSGGSLLLITPIMFTVYMTMMHGWNNAVTALARFQTGHPDANPADKLKSRPLTMETIKSVEESERYRRLKKIRDEDAESVGSSVVEFHPLSDLDSSKTDSVQSHPL